MHLKHYAVAAAAVTAMIPAGLLAAEAGASIARDASAPVATAAAAPTVTVHSTKKFGKILVTGKGFALYLYAKDGKNKSNCTGSCASVWPPLMAKGKLRAGSGASRSKLGEIKRGSGHQVTYAGHPLYTFQSDGSPGQVMGENFQNFFVVSPSGKAIKR